MKLHAAVNQTAASRDLFITPPHLAESLNQLPAATRKTVILQGCYSGSFLTDGTDTLAAVPNLTAIAASRPDRPSFGCDPGRSVTLFAECFFYTLAQHPGPPETLDWPPFTGISTNWLTRSKPRAGSHRKSVPKPVLLITPPPSAKLPPSLN